MPSSPIIYTIGHGRHPLADFVALLRQHEIELVCDVRSAARSRWPQYNGRVLEESLRERGIGYEHLPECGGKTLAPPAELRIALLCSESQPLTNHREPRANCHRVGLLGPPLRARGARLKHILPTGEALEIDETSIPSIW